MERSLQGFGGLSNRSGPVGTVRFSGQGTTVAPNESQDTGSFGNLNVHTPQKSKHSTCVPFQKVYKTRCLGLHCKTPYSEKKQIEKTRLQCISQIKDLYF